MNKNLGLLGTKLGCTQIFLEDGSRKSVTVIEAGPCTVLSKRTPDKHGYAALQLGFGTGKPKQMSKAELGSLRSVGVQEGAEPAVVREFRVPPEKLEQYEVGQVLRVSELFTEGTRVDVLARSKGRGYTGVIKRHNFHGAGTVGHGTHEYKRHGGSIGMNMTPGRTLRGQKMAGHHGNENVSMLRLKVTKVMDEENLVLVEGGVPGPNRGLVTIRPTVKVRRVERQAADA